MLDNTLELIAWQSNGMDQLFKWYKAKLWNFFAKELLEAVDSLDAGQFGEILTKECKKHLIILKNGWLPGVIYHYWFVG